MSSRRHLRIGTRISPLAMRQAEWVAHQLTVWGGQVELVPITTEGDRVKNETIGTFGSPGVFTKELATGADRRPDRRGGPQLERPADRPGRGIGLGRRPARARKWPTS